MKALSSDNLILIVMSDEELAAVDDWRFANRFAARSDAIRRLCKLALSTTLAPKAEGDK